MLMSLLVLATLLSTSAAAYFAGRNGAIQADQLQGQFPLINATAAVSSEKYSIATGPMGGDSEGFFVLDHNSGLLQCSVIYPRARPPQFLAQFQINVADALGTGAKGGSYMMVTGTAQFLTSSSNPAASSVVYVIDTASGNWACFGIPFNRAFENSNRPQQAAMLLLNTGSANPVIDRDNLR
jgi:hypothetical protein